MSPLNSWRQRARQMSGRNRSLGLFAGTSLFARGLGMAGQVLQVPLAVHALGAEAFGLWMTLMSVSTLATFADFGLGQGAQNVMAEALAAGDGKTARQTATTALYFLFFMSAVVALAGAGLIGLLDVNHVFGLRDDATRQAAKPAIAAVLAVFCLNFPLGFAQRLAYARQKGWLHNLAQAVSVVLALAGVALAARAHASLVTIIVVAQGPLALANGILLLIQLIELRWNVARRSYFSGARLRSMLRLGGYFSLQQILNLLLFSAPQIVISTALGAAAVTPYNVLQRFFNVFGVIQNAFMLPLWPAYSEAKARGEMAWVRRTLKRSVAATLVCTVAPMAVATLLAGPLIKAWVGSGAVQPPKELIWLMFAWTAAVFLQQPFGYLLAGFSEVKRTTLYALASAGACGFLMTRLVHPLGPAGVVIGLLLGAVPFNLLGNMFEAWKIVRLPKSDLVLLPAENLEMKTS